MGILSMLFGKSSNATYLKELYAKGALIVDVRTPEEFNRGHIKDSINIPLQALNQKINSLKQKKKAIITVCQSGSRSSMAVNVLKGAGIDAYNGGGWNSMQNIIK